MDPKGDIINIKNHTLVETPNFKFGASNVEACRICLATDVKMYSLQDTHLGRCIESVTGIDKSDGGLPNYVCYECAPCLIKCNKLIEKSRRAQATLQDIFSKNGQITKTLIEEQNRSKLNLQSPLDSYLLINYYHIVSDSDVNTSNCTEPQTDLDEKIVNLLKNELKEESEEDIDISEDRIRSAEMSTDEDDVQEIKADIPVIEVLSDDDTNKDDFISLKPYMVKMDSRAKGLITHKNNKPMYDVPKTKNIHKMRLMKGTAKKDKKKKKKKIRNMNIFTSPTPEETYMQKYFNVDVIPIQKTNNTKYSCKFCFKSFNNINDARDHRIIGCSVSQSGNANSLAISFSEPGQRLPKANEPLFWEDWDGDRI